MPGERRHWDRRGGRRSGCKGGQALVPVKGKTVQQYTCVWLRGGEGFAFRV